MPSSSNELYLQLHADLTRRLREALAGQVCDPFGGPAGECRHCLEKAGAARPFGRDAVPGDLGGGYELASWMYPYKCRRCHQVCTKEGHPYGCPWTPGDHIALWRAAMRPCYCGETVVLTPAWLAPCCQDTPPVRMPVPCSLCGVSECRVCDPDDQPEGDSSRGGWSHARCQDEKMPKEHAAARQAKRRTPLGVVG